MSRFWPPIFRCTRSNSGFISLLWNDNHDEAELSFWPDSLVLNALTKRDFRNPKSNKKQSAHRASFRENTILAYENRLRRHSDPMKVFRYFATIKMKSKGGKWDVFMTPQDFLRSILPGMRQPEHLTLARYRLLDEGAAEKWRAGAQKDSIFLTLGDTGLLNFSDYVLLTILLSIPERHVWTLLKLLDYDEDGTVSMQDLEHIMLVISMGEASMVNSHLKGTLFGPRLKKKLSINEFLEFLQRLNKEILVKEYEMLLKDSRSVITELDFAKVLLAYTKSERQRRAALERVKEKFGQQKIGISLEEFMAFSRLVQDVEAVDMALAFHFLAGADIRPDTLQHIAHVVADVELSPHLMAVIYTVFDHDGDGIIRRGEFTKTLRDRMRRVQHKKRLRLKSGICILGKCCWKTLPFRSRSIATEPQLRVRGSGFLPSWCP